MPVKKIYQTILILLVITINVGCDQLSKNIVRNKISYDQEIDLLDRHLIITRVENTGAFLSLWNSLSGPVRWIALLLLPLSAIVIGMIYLFRKSSLPLPVLLGICCVTGGGLGNLYDRLVHGSVTDFLYMNLVVFHTGIFNLADVSITTGIIIILINVYLQKPASPESPKTAA